MPDSEHSENPCRAGAALFIARGLRERDAVKKQLLDNKFATWFELGVYSKDEASYLMVDELPPDILCIADESSAATRLIFKAVKTRMLTALPSKNNRGEEKFAYAEIVRWLLTTTIRPKFFFPESREVARTPDGIDIDTKSETTYLSIVAALVSLHLEVLPGKTQSLFQNQTELIEALLEKFPNVKGITQRTLDRKLPEAKAHLKRLTICQIQWR
jgi:hypothetical protein